MPDSPPTFHVMPVGWEHAAWRGRFYPVDLPEDWRLSYYANEFSEVLVEPATWIDAGEDQLRSWVDDVSENFRFFLMLSQAVGLFSLERQIELLGESLGGLVFAPDTAGTEWGDELAVMAQGHQIELFEAAEATFHAPLPAVSLSRGMGPALIFSGKDYGDLRTQRVFFEQLQDKVKSDAHILLCFTGDPPQLEPIGKLRELARLMGLA